MNEIDKTLDHIANKFNLDLTTKSPIEIPNFGRVELAKLFNELGFTIGTEVGIERGEYSEILLRSNPKLRLFSVDAWQVYNGYRDHTNQKTMDKIYKEAKKRLAKYNCKLIKKLSADAVKSFKYESLDFVYIDASHEFSHVAHDLVEWSKRVRPGGIVAGHDYIKKTDPGYQSHVVDALHGYVAAYNISPWFILGRKSVVDGEVRDRPRSFMFVKNSEIILRPHSF